MQLFDSHAHYEDAMFAADRYERLRRIKDSDVKYILNCCSDVEVMDTVIDIIEKFDFAYGSIGVHPHWTAQTPENYLEKVEKLAAHPKVVSIGEIGLDYFWDEPKDLQKKIFVQQLELAQKLDMPVIIHDRDAHEDTIEILEQYKPRGILHRYSGPVNILQKAFDFGSARRPHRKDGDCGTRVQFFKLQGLFQCVEIFGVEDCRKCGTVNGAVFLHSIFAHITSVGHLFCQDNDIQTHKINMLFV